VNRGCLEYRLQPSSALLDGKARLKSVLLTHVIKVNRGCLEYRLQPGSALLDGKARLKSVL